MDDIPPLPERLRPEEMLERARAAVAEGRTIPCERMTDWFLAMERSDEVEAPETDAETDPGSYRTLRLP